MRILCGNFCSYTVWISLFKSCQPALPDLPSDVMYIMTLSARTVHLLTLEFALKIPCSATPNATTVKMSYRKYSSRAGLLGCINAIKYFREQAER